MEEYRPNSNRFKEEQRTKEREKQEKVVTGKVVTKKPSKFRKITNEFISDEAKNVKYFIFGEVLIPTIKNAISDIVRNGVDMILFGESRPGNKRSAANRVSYRDYYDRDYKTRNDRPSLNSGYFFDDIILDSRGEAQDVLDRLDEIMDSYKLVSVADLYDLVGITPPPTANGYGWTNIRNADIVRVRNGYLIKMPKAAPIDRF